MNSKLIKFLAAAFALAANASFAIEGQVEVLSDNVNLRARPLENAEVAGQVHRGAVLDLRGIAGDWFGVAVPTNIGLWVNSGFVVDGKITADKLNVRAGAGINYPSVGVILRDAPVEIRSQVGQWTEIGPPISAVLWIHGDYVRPVSTQTGFPMAPPVIPEQTGTDYGDGYSMSSSGPTNAAPVQSSDSTDESVKSTPAVSEVASLREHPQPPPDIAKRGLVPLKGQGESMEKEGSLQKTSILDFGRASNYCLVDWRNGRPITICYIRGNNAQLKEFVGRRLKVKGEGYWIRGGAKPVIVPRQITPLVAGK